MNKDIAFFQLDLTYVSYEINIFTTLHQMPEIGFTIYFNVYFEYRKFIKRCRIMKHVISVLAFLHVIEPSPN